MREHLGEKLDAYLDKTLDAAGRREVEEHVAGCPSCGKDLQGLKALAAQMEAARPAPPQKASFRAYWDRLLGRHGEVKTMTATQRLTRIVQSNVHAAIDSMENPAKMIRQLLREMESALAGAREELAESMAIEVRITRRAEAAEAAGRGWEEKAALALRSSREDLAREALGEKVSQAALAEELRAEAGRQKARVAGLRCAYERLSRQFEELRRRKPVWLTRAQGALGPAGSKEAYRAAYGELSRIVEDVEVEADVEGALAELEGPVTLEETLGELSRAEVLDRELDVLKRRLQK